MAATPMFPGSKRSETNARSGSFALEIALGALIVAALAGCAGSAATHTRGAGATPRTSATASAGATSVPDATPTPTAAGSATAAATIGPCTAVALDIKLTPQDGLDWQAASGHHEATFTLTNAGTVACQVKAKSQPLLVNGDGLTLVTGAAPGASDWIAVDPGATLKTKVQTSNLCTKDTIIAPLRIAFAMPGGSGTVVAMPASSSDVGANPGCAGDPATPSGTIEMQPWAP